MTGSAVSARDELVGVGRLRRYSITGLFGSRDFSFEIADTGPTVLFGKNGTGKSTVLRTIGAVGSGDWPRLASLPFESLSLEFANADPLNVARSESGLVVAFEDRAWTFDPARFRPDSEDMPPRLPGLRRTRAGWEYQGKIYTGEELARIGALHALYEHDGADWVPDVPRRFPVLFITDQRLTIRGDHMATTYPGSYRDPSRTIVAVAQFARELADQIGRTLSAYASSSQRYDQAFPRKVVDAMEAAGEIERSEVEHLLDLVAGEVESLQRVGLLSEVPVHFDRQRLEAADVRPVIKAFAEDTLAKFAVLDQTRSQLEIFTNFINAHYDNKRIEIEPDVGFLIRLPDGSQLRPSRLSSGEQQMLALAYQMLFRTQPGTLVLVDEPELSLHVLWQQSLISDLTSMAAARDLSFLLATHSPTVIGDRRELMRSLDVAQEQQIMATASRSDEPSDDGFEDQLLDGDEDYVEGE